MSDADLTRKSRLHRLSVHWPPVGGEYRKATVRRDETQLVPIAPRRARYTNSQEIYFWGKTVSFLPDSQLDSEPRKTRFVPSLQYRKGREEVRHRLQPTQMYTTGRPQTRRLGSVVVMSYCLCPRELGRGSVYTSGGKSRKYSNGTVESL